MQLITDSVSNLEKSLPAISQKLPWDKPLFLKSQKMKTRVQNANVKSRVENPYARGSRSENNRELQKVSKDKAKDEYHGKLSPFNIDRSASFLKTGH